MPILHVVAGPNGAGKSTYVARILYSVLHLPSVNADVIATKSWPGARAGHAYEASRVAEYEHLETNGFPLLWWLSTSR